MSLVFTIPGMLGLAIQLFLFVYFARALPLGALSLPCVTILTSLVYFYVMPVVSVLAGFDTFFGMSLTSLEETHWVALLYVSGATIACIVNRRQLLASPNLPREGDTRPNDLIYMFLWGTVVLSLTSLYFLGQLNIFQDQSYRVTFENSTLNFLNLGMTIAASLTLVYLVRNNFGVRSLGLLVIILYVYSIAGFRFRILILLCAATICFALVRRIRIRVWMAVAGGMCAITLMNLFATIRSYGGGLNYSGIQDKSLMETISHFYGEIGVVYVAQYIASNPFIQLIGLEPWIVAVTRFVPTFLWPGKPAVSYTLQFSAGFTAPGALDAGIAASQQVEMLLQFGWVGVPFLAFLYFFLICRLNSAVLRLGRETRIAGCALIPPFFGYYMQTRGYFFQMFAEAIFTFFPLFLLNIKALRPAVVASRGRIAAQRK